ncbi:MAG: patatin family protein [Patescibacteria group bacterium]
MQNNSNLERRKIVRALAADGGGMRGAFTAGLLAGFRDQGIGHSFFDFYIGSSAGACTLTYYLTDQVDEGIRIWQEHLPNGFMKWRGIRPYNDLDYLGKIFREIEPLSVSTLRSRKEQTFAAVSNPQTLEAEYINLNSAPDPVRILLAGVAMPFFTGPVVINDRPYYDGGITSAIPFKKAEADGANEVWVVATTPIHYRRKPLRWRVASWFITFDPQVRKLIANRPVWENQTLEEIERRTDLVVIRPTENLPVHWRNSDKGAIRATVEIGRQTAKNILAERRITA